MKVNNSNTPKQPQTENQYSLPDMIIPELDEDFVDMLLQLPPRSPVELSTVSHLFGTENQTGIPQAFPVLQIIKSIKKS